ncbi:MAG: FkbM family methyltransferase [Alphaproteobacteria bacterium]|nr:FkbM family methyltransferase [Alphaproteobacteria bacterium]
MEEIVCAQYGARLARFFHPPGATGSCMQYSSMDAQQRRDAIFWAYRLFLGREPESEEVVAIHAAQHRSLQDLQACFLLSAEFVNQSDHHLGEFLRTRLYDSVDPRRPPGGAVVEGIIPRLRQAPDVVDERFFYDFMGTKARLSFQPANHGYLAGRVEAPPTAGAHLFHDNEEWFALLRTLAEARDSLVVVELGAGWGPWIAAAGVGARRLGITNVKLVAAEADPGHLAFLRQNLADNDLLQLMPDIRHAIVGPRDGTALFPRLDQPSEHWGAAAHYDAAPWWRRWRRPRDEHMVALPSLSLPSLLRDHAVVDLMHVDIQGAEGEVLSAAAPTIDAKVRRLAVGTHSRGMEEVLLSLFGGLGWTLENEAACEMKQFDTPGMVLNARDGVQVWRNPKL